MSALCGRLNVEWWNNWTKEKGYAIMNMKKGTALTVPFWQHRLRRWLSLIIVTKNNRSNCLSLNCGYFLSFLWLLIVRTNVAKAIANISASKTDKLILSRKQVTNQHRHHPISIGISHHINCAVSTIYSI